MELKTEYEFVLPRGYVDKDGNLHNEGVMRHSECQGRDRSVERSACPTQPGVSNTRASEQGDYPTRYAQ